MPLGGLLGLRAGVPGNAELGRAFLYHGDRLVELGASIADEQAGEGPTEGGTTEAVAEGADVVVDCRAGEEVRPRWAVGRGVFLAGDVLRRDLHEMYGIGRRVAVVGPGALAAEVALFLAGWGRRPTVVVPGPPDDPFPDVHPMHAARLRERLEGYKVPLLTGATPVGWRYDPGRKSELVVGRGGGEEVLGPFHTAITVAGWAAPPGQAPRVAGAPVAGVPGDETRWPQAVFGLEVPGDVPDGSVLRLGDTLYPEPLRDLVQYAHLVGRAI
jgi:hypothetical protein